MRKSRSIGRKRTALVTTLVAPMAIVGWMLAGAAMGASSTKPSMEVVPKPTGLKYGQTVEIKAHHLPKGSGSVAATICGLEDAKGKVIANPGADDCAGQNELGTLVVLKQWQSNGEFDTKYTLPASGKKFGKNQRDCDKSHHCALVVADANPSSPAYHVDQVIQFTDQKPFGSGGSTPTTKPKTTTTKLKATTTTTTAPPGITFSGSGGISLDPNQPGISGGGHVTGHPPAGIVPTPPAGPPTLPTLPKPGGNPVPAPVGDALNQVCGKLADAVKQAGGDASALVAACNSIAAGSGPDQAAAILKSPSLLCVAGASAWQNNAEVTGACNQAAAGIAPITGPIAGALGPVLSNL